MTLLSVEKIMQSKTQITNDLKRSYKDITFEMVLE